MDSVVLLALAACENEGDLSKAELAEQDELELESRFLNE